MDRGVMRNAAILMLVLLQLCAAFLAAETGRIEVRRADFGLRAEYCNAKAALASLCNGKSSCEIEVQPLILCPGGEDPVPGATKKLSVKYSCGDRVRTLKSRGEPLVRLDCTGSELITAEAIEFVGRTFSNPVSSNPVCSREELREAEDPEADHSASCWRVCVEIPLEAEIKVVSGWSRKANKVKWKPCGNLPGSCESESESFYNDYRVESTLSGQKVCWTFRNWSTEIDREAKLTVQYVVAAE